MADTLTPRVGSWYQELEQELIFEVVAYDEDEQTIEIQYIDGELDEFDEENWAELALEEIEEPEDWRNAYELSKEDYDDHDDRISAQGFPDGLNDVEPDDLDNLAGD